MRYGEARTVVAGHHADVDSGNGSGGGGGGGGTTGPLVDGEVVVMTSGGVPYVVRKLPSLVDEKVVSSYICELSAANEVVETDNPAAQFVVVVQGGWVGFRSVIAGGRLLQVRKRGTKRLCFFSTRFGTWEQFSVDETAGSGSDKHEKKEHARKESNRTSVLSLVLRSRRLEKFTLAVDVVRVPPERVATSLLTPGSSGSVGGIHGGEDTSRLTRTRRKTRVDFSVDPVTRIVTPHELFADGKNNTAGDKTRRSSLIRAEDEVQSADAGDAAGDSATALAGVSQGGVMNAMSDLLVSEWSTFVLKEVRQRQTLEKEIKRLHLELGDVHDAAMEEIGRARDEGLERARLAVDEVGSIMKTVVDERGWAMALLRRYCTKLASKRHLRRSLHAWAEAVGRNAYIKASCFMMWKARKRQTQLLGLALQRRWTRTEARAFGVWRLTCDEKRRRDIALMRAVERRRRRCTARMVSAWRQYAADMKKMESSMLGLAMMRQSHAVMLSQCVRHWRATVEARRRWNHKVAAMLERRARVMARLIILSWADTTRRRVSGRTMLLRMATRCDMTLSRIVVHAWYAMCSAKQDAHASHAEAVDEAVGQTEAEMERMRILQIAFDGFRSNGKMVRHRVKLFHFMSRVVQKMLVREAFREWRDLYECMLSSRNDAASLITRNKLAFSIRVFLKWQQVARESRLKSINLENIALRIRRSRALSKRTVWQEWVGLVIKSREKQILATVISCASDRARRRIALSTGWNSWRTYMAGVRRNQRILLRCAATRVRHAMAVHFREWRDEVFRIGQRLECVRTCIKSKRLLMQWWMAWYWDAHEPDIRHALSSLYGNCEDAMEEIYEDKTPKIRTVFRDWQKSRNAETVSQDMRTFTVINNNNTHAATSGLTAGLMDTGDSDDVKGNYDDITSAFRQAVTDTFSA